MAEEADDDAINKRLNDLFNRMETKIFKELDNPDRRIAVLERLIGELLEANKRLTSIIERLTTELQKKK